MGAARKLFDIDWTPPPMCTGFIGALFDHDWYPLNPKISVPVARKRCARCGVVYPKLPIEQRADASETPSPNEVEK